MPANNPILRKCSLALNELYGKRLKGVVLYGSCARGEDSPDSDLDLMVLLQGPVNLALEIRRIWDVLYPVQLESDQVISIMPADEESYRKGEYALYRKVVEEGVPI